MRTLLVEAVLPHKSGITRDAVVNTFVVETPDTWVGDSTDLGDVTIPIAQFYAWTGPSGNTLGYYLSNELSRTADAVTLNVYDISTHLDGSPHGPPIAIDHQTLPNAASVQNLPGEVAVVLTTRAEGWEEAVVERADADIPADAKRDRPKQRHSGRLFLGPFCISALDVDAAPLYISRPINTLRHTIFEAAGQVFDNLAAGGIGWMVWSRKDQVTRNITAFQVDDAWDTQRRRGVRPSFRETRDADAIVWS